MTTSIRTNNPADPYGVSARPVAAKPAPEPAFVIKPDFQPTLEDPFGVGAPATTPATAASAEAARMKVRNDPTAGQQALKAQQSVAPSLQQIAAGKGELSADKGQLGASVSQVRDRLNGTGLTPQISGAGPTAAFGAQDKAAVQQFQLKNGLLDKDGLATGVVDQQTLAGINNAPPQVTRYDQAAVDTIAKVGSAGAATNLGVGQHGETVENAQQAINDYNKKRYEQEAIAKDQQLAPLEADGFYGRDTEAQVKRIQELSDLEATGKIDDDTWKAIQKGPAAREQPTFERDGDDLRIRGTAANEQFDIRRNDDRVTVGYRGKGGSEQGFVVDGVRGKVQVDTGAGNDLVTAKGNSISASGSGVDAYRLDGNGNTVNTLKSSGAVIDMRGDGNTVDAIGGPAAVSYRGNHGQVVLGEGSNLIAHGDGNSFVGRGSNQGYVGGNDNFIDGANGRPDAVLVSGKRNTVIGDEDDVGASIPTDDPIAKAMRELQPELPAPGALTDRITAPASRDLGLMTDPGATRLRAASDTPVGELPNVKLRITELETALRKNGPAASHVEHDRKLGLQRELELLQQGGAGLEQLTGASDQNRNLSVAKAKIEDLEPEVQSLRRQVRQQEQLSPYVGSPQAIERQGELDKKQAELTALQRQVKLGSGYTNSVQGLQRLAAGESVDLSALRQSLEQAGLSADQRDGVIRYYQSLAK